MHVTSLIANTWYHTELTQIDGRHFEIFKDYKITKTLVKSLFGKENRPHKTDESHFFIGKIWAYNRPAKTGSSHFHHGPVSCHRKRPKESKMGPTYDDKNHPT